jgi:glycosyltransferase involved in cell wall biosynthesis
MSIDILHLAYTRFPADTRVKREVDALRATGRRIGVIALRGPGERAVERWRDVTIIRAPGRKSRGGVVSYLLEYGDFVWRCRRLIARHRALSAVRVVHTHTLPDFLLWAALPAQRRGARLVFDMHEIFPEFAASKFGGTVGKLTERLALAVERWARRRADVTITVNRLTDQVLAKRPIGRPERRLIIHNTADPADFGEGGPPPEVGKVITLVYHGTLTVLYGLDLAVRAVALLRRAGRDVRLTILGDGPERDALTQLTTELGLDSAVTLEAPLPQRALPARLRACAAGVVPTRLDGMTQYSLSTKLLEYAHLGIPVLAARLPGYEQYFGERALWYWTPGDPADLARAVSDFATASPAERAQRARRAKEAIASLDWAHEREGLLAAYADLLEPGGKRSASTAAMRSAARPSP